MCPHLESVSWSSLNCKISVNKSLFICFWLCRVSLNLDSEDSCNLRSLSMACRLSRRVARSSNMSLSWVLSACSSFRLRSFWTVSLFDGEACLFGGSLLGEVLSVNVWTVNWQSEASDVSKKNNQIFKDLQQNWKKDSKFCNPKYQVIFQMSDDYQMIYHHFLQANRSLSY